MSQELPKGLEAWKKFFEPFEEYTSFEIALRTGIKPRTIRKWRRLCGMKRDAPQSAWLTAHRMPKAPEVAHEPLDKSVWDNHDWIYEHYVVKGLSTAKIAKICGGRVYHHTIKHRLKKYEIRIRSFEESMKSKNPYFNKEWLVENYVNQVKSIEQCAEIANVNYYTIVDWLVKFGICIVRQHTETFGNRRILKRKRDKGLLS